jgi:pantothenate synthetase
MKEIDQFLNDKKNELEAKFNIKIEYLDVRNIINLKNTNINKNYKLFIAYYISGVRLIDNF